MIYPELPYAHELASYHRDGNHLKAQISARHWKLIRYHLGAILDILFGWGGMSVALAFLSVTTAAYA